MGKFYGKKILAGVITIEQVPEYWRAKTEQWLVENTNV